MQHPCPRVEVPWRSRLWVGAECVCDEVLHELRLFAVSLMVAGWVLGTKLLGHCFEVLHHAVVYQLQCSSSGSSGKRQHL